MSPAAAELEEAAEAEFVAVVEALLVLVVLESAGQFQVKGWERCYREETFSHAVLIRPKPKYFFYSNSLIGNLVHECKVETRAYTYYIVRLPYGTFSRNRRPSLV